MSFTAHWKCRSAEVQKLVVSMPMGLAKVSQKEGWITHYKYIYVLIYVRKMFFYL
jgi:hypothetical protein